MSASNLNNATIAAMLVAVGFSQVFAQAPATQPAASAPAVSAQPRMPEYVGTTRIAPGMLRGGQHRQMFILQSEPGEPGQDPMQRSSGAVAKLLPDAHRLPEGYVVAGRPATIQRDDIWHILRFEPMTGAPDVPPLRVLPNKQLTMMEAVVAAATSPPDFAVTGRVTEFQGVNYILIEHLTEISAEPALQVEADTVEPTVETNEDISTQPAVAGEPRADDIVRALMESKPQRAVVLPDNRKELSTDDDKPGQPAIDAADKTGEGPRWPEETVLVDRPGRVQSGDLWWSLAFEDQGRNPGLKPIRLLPSRLLDSAIALSQVELGATVLLISGEITEYQRANYLLIRKVLVRPDLGNLR